MFAKTRAVAAKYGVKVAVAGSALMASAAFAQEADPGAQILAEVKKSMTSGAGIATTVVLGFFAIWAIKVLWKSK